eukprot:88698_1
MPKDINSNNIHCKKLSVARDLKQTLKIKKLNNGRKSEKQSRKNTKPYASKPIYKKLLSSPPNEFINSLLRRDILNRVQAKKWLKRYAKHENPQKLRKDHITTIINQNFATTTQLMNIEDSMINESNQSIESGHDSVSVMHHRLNPHTRHAAPNTKIDMTKEQIAINDFLATDAVDKEMESEQSNEILQVPQAEADDIKWRGQMQAEPQEMDQKEEMKSPNTPFNGDYAKGGTHRMKRVIQDMRMEHTQQTECIQSTHVQEYQNMQKKKYRKRTRLNSS